MLKRLPRLRSTCHRLVTQEQRLKDAALRGELGTVACKDPGDTGGGKLGVCMGRFVGWVEGLPVT